MKKKILSFIPYIYLLIAIGLTIFIFVHSFLPGNKSIQAASPVVEISADIVNAIKPGTIPEVRPDWFIVLIRKLIGHFGLCGLDGIFIFLSTFYLFPIKKTRKSWWSLIPSISIGLLISLSTELIQLFVSGRRGDIIDALIDFSGFTIASIGMMLIFFIVNLIIKKRNDKQEKMDI